MKQIFKLLLLGFSLIGGIGILNANDITKVDKNFEVVKVEGKDVRYRNALEEPFVLEGFYWRKAGEPLYRLPYDRRDDKKISDGVRFLSWHTSGGAIRFATDSDIIVLRVRLKPSWDNPVQPRSGSAGFDLYYRNRDGSSVFVANAAPKPDEIKGNTSFERRLYKGEGKMRPYILWLPLYSGIESLEIGLSPKARLIKPDAHRIANPIVFYGSSITQGAAASRPSNNYTTRLARAVDAPLVNLGFSGNAKGELEMARILSEIKAPAAFVYDYDHNAPTVKHLWDTHEAFFKEFRKHHPNTPVIILTSFDKWGGYSKERDRAIQNTYNNAVKRGDKNVYFLNAHTFFDEVGGPSAISTDNCHPDDVGFFFMYKNVLPVLVEALKNSGAIPADK